MAQWRIHPLVMGSKVFDKSMMTYQHHPGTEYTIPIYTWYLQGDHGVVLVDTGEAHPIRSEAREAAIGASIVTFEEGLGAFGLKPEDVDTVVHTHLHADHCENDAACVNARIYTHQAELDNLEAFHPLDYRYLDEHMEGVLERGQVECVEDGREILPGIRVRHHPIHTEGGLSVYVDTPRGLAVIPSCCLLWENFYPPREIRAMEVEAIPPGTVCSPKAAYDMMLEIRQEADFLLPLHEPRLARLRAIPDDWPEAWPEDEG
ncbi:N-acyl homoserine lactonase family protein [Desulfohalovibrio reitneri]|uniref:N-acyl homoserine lactonase family protein n=1 Tax=Desulfohalovibrio reitneri TaxID=1307759 RepID=UPI00069029B2|nr:N-acyl homoserine lactonase family protein [Desulfohalovibrio reitneri]